MLIVLNILLSQILSFGKHKNFFQTFSDYFFPFWETNVHLNEKIKQYNPWLRDNVDLGMDWKNQTFAFYTESPIIYMQNINQIIQKGQQFFNSFVDQVENLKIGDISVRRAVKKYDVKNLKIDNVTPLRAKKLYSSILPKYSKFQLGIKAEQLWTNLGFKTKEDSLYGVHFAIFTKNKLKQIKWTMFPLKQLDLIKFQVYSLVKKDNKNCQWSKEEDQLLKTIIEKQSGKTIEWSNISKQFFTSSKQLFFRNAKQCRERWLNHLDPTKTKGKWQLKQDRILLEQVLQKGKKWSRIVQFLNGKKNQHMIKNRFKSLIHKKEKQNKNKKLKENELIKLILKDIQDMKEENQSESENSSQKMLSQYVENDIEQISEQKNSLNQFERSDSQKKVSSHQMMSQQNSANEDKNTKKDENCFSEKTKNNNVSTNNDIQVEVCGNKDEKEFVNNLFFSVNTPVAEERLQSINLDSQSPANIFMSPFPGSCWTPTIFLLDDTQGQIGDSLALDDFSLASQNTMKKFLKEQN